MVTYLHGHHGVIEGAERRPRLGDMRAVTEVKRNVEACMKLRSPPD